MTTRPKLNRIWASSNPILRRDPGDSKYSTGWISEIPTYQVLNYLQYKIDVTLLALAERGFFEWGSDVQYGLNSIVWDDTDRGIYVAIVGNPSKTLAPSKNPSHWSKSSIQLSQEEYNSVKDKINTHIQDTNNPHKVTASQINAYTKSEIDSLLKVYTNLVQNHVKDTNNPHKVTAAAIGAVPITGGTYYGTITFRTGRIYLNSSKSAGVNTDNGLVSLVNSPGYISVSTTGVVTVGNTNTKVSSKIMTEDEYTQLKSQEEPDYAVREPNLLMDFNNSINMRIGVGTVSTNFTPSYNSSTGALSITNSTSTQTCTGDKSISGSGFTIACDILSASSRVSSDTSKSIYVGLVNSTKAIGIQYTGSGLVKAVSSYGSTEYSATFQLTDAINTWHRVVAVITSSSIKLYIDGVLKSTKSISLTTVGGAMSLQTYSKTTSYRRSWCFRGFKVWNSALTDKQVSTL